MSVDAILERSPRVRQTGRDTWIASCSGPTHSNGDRDPSLGIRVLGDGKVLLKCHAGCSTQEILDALGLTMADLFPPREERHHGRTQRWHGVTAREALKGLAFEATFVGVCARYLAAGKVLEDDDRARLSTAIGRIGVAEEICRG